MQLCSSLTLKWRSPVTNCQTPITTLKPSTISALQRLITPTTSAFTKPDAKASVQVCARVPKRPRSTGQHPSLTLVQLATSLTNSLSSRGIQTRLATNDTVTLPCTICLDVSTYHYLRGRSYIDGRKHWQIQTLGNLGYALTQHIAYDLWVGHAVPADICTSSRQRYYELCRLGTIPLHIALPSDTLSTHMFASTYADAIASSIWNWLNQRK